MNKALFLCNKNDKAKYFLPEICSGGKSSCKFDKKKNYQIGNISKRENFKQMLHDGSLCHIIQF